MPLTGRSRRFALALLPALLAAAPFMASRAMRPLPHTGSAPVSSEVRALRAHFDSVLRELRARDVRTLPASLRAQRGQLVTVLAEYRTHTEFPHNYDFPGRPTPYFVDRKTGVLCAVAYLLESTGRRDIVDRVARTNNNVWVAELAGDSAFTGWLDAHGLTLNEAARIQVPYTSSTKVQAGYMALTVTGLAATGAAAATSIWNATGNADGHNRLGRVLGLTSGILVAGIGGVAAMQPDATKALRGTAGIGAAIGGVSVALSTRAMQRHGRLLAAERDVQRRRTAVETSFAPIVPVGPNAGTGMTMSIRF